MWISYSPSFEAAVNRTAALTAFHVYAGEIVDFESVSVEFCHSKVGSFKNVKTVDELSDSEVCAMLVCHRRNPSSWFVNVLIVLFLLEILTPIRDFVSNEGCDES